MPDPTTTNRGFTIPNNGADVGTWDVPVNGNMNLLDTMLGAVASVSVSSANVTLSASSYQRGVIQFTGTLVNSVLMTLPSVSAWWTIQNNTTGNFRLQFSCGGGNLISIPQGNGGIDIYTDGSNVNFRNLPMVGTYVTYAATAVPVWITGCTVQPYLNCDGSTFSAVTYPILNQILGGTTLPDMRGRAMYTADQGTGRIGSQISPNTVGAGGGTETTALTSQFLPAVTYSFSNTGNTFVTNVSKTTAGFANGGNTAVTNISVSGPTAPAGTIGPLGSGTAFTNLPPAMIGGITMIRAG